MPSVAKRGVWDLALAAWAPDWYGDAALAFFGPLFSGPSSYPPVGSNFGFYNNPSVTALTGQGATSGSASAAATIWGQADQKVMQDAPFYPISQPLQPLYHASYVHNAVYVPGHPAVRPDEHLAELARAANRPSRPGGQPAHGRAAHLS